MGFQRIDLNLIVALEALMAQQSVSAAASRLRVSQPATSHAADRAVGHTDRMTNPKVGT